MHIATYVRTWADSCKPLSNFLIVSVIDLTLWNKYTHNIITSTVTHKVLDCLWWWERYTMTAKITTIMIVTAVIIAMTIPTIAPADSDVFSSVGVLVVIIINKFK